MLNKSNKIIFANNLRGIAALLVLISHFYGVYWYSPNAVHSLLLIQPTHLTHDGFNELFKIINFSELIDYGQLGVSIFFLISGFVIPFALKKYKAKQFLANRFIRIYPLYWIALTISLLALWTSRFGLTLSHKFPSIVQIIKQAMLIRDFFWIPSIDGVSWTLEIEIKFYVIALIYASIVKKNFSLSSLLLFVFAIFTASLSSPIFPSTIKLVVQFAFPFIIYMFIGTVFHLMFSGEAKSSYAVSSIFVLFFSFLISLFFTYQGESTFQISINYGISLIVFTITYFYRNRINSNLLLSFLADISYPLYAVHAILGYAILEKLHQMGVNAYLSVGLVTVIVLTVAWVLHITVEISSQKWSQRSILFLK